MNSDCLSVITAPSTHLLGNLELDCLVRTPPLPQCQVCVIVPVRNEAELLKRTLTALTNQVDLQGHPLESSRYEIILLANNCSDDSAAIARDFANQHPELVLHVVERSLPPAKAHIGWVRKRLMDEACYRLMSIGRSRGVIASTDGDTQVAIDWIAATLHEIACGADAVGGRIVTDRCDRAALDSYTKACHLREVGYHFLVTELASYLDPDPFDPFPRHFQHYGASLAVTAEMYHQVGGLPLVKSSEDVALYRALLRVNAQFRHSPLVRVITSARQVGRAQKGLADQLNAWASMGQQQQSVLVEPAGAIATRLQAHRELKQLWQRSLNGHQFTSQEIALPADRLGVDRDWLSHAMTQCTSLNKLFERIEQRQTQEGIWQKRWCLVPIEQSIWDLRLLLEPLRRQRNQTQYQQQMRLSKRLHKRQLPLTG